MQEDEYYFFEKPITPGKVSTSVNGTDRIIGVVINGPLMEFFLKFKLTCLLMMAFVGAVSSVD